VAREQEWWNMEMWLELVPLPVSDVDRAKAFYEKVGFDVDLDDWPTNELRVVQMTPPGSPCSIMFGTGLGGGISEMEPGSLKVLHLVVKDVEQSRRAMLDRGIEVSDICELGRGVKYVYFSDPDGNSWGLQEMPWRSPEFD
jgi:predicted enzyme related to lactoylglutathione lyase